MKATKKIVPVRKLRPIHRRRLEDVARVNAERDDGGFTMYTFRTMCGTPGCVLGGYAARRDVQDVFCLVRDQYGLHNAAGETVGYDAPEVRQHFGITKAECAVLFSSDGCGGARTAPVAAAFIRGWLAAHP